MYATETRLRVRYAETDRMGYAYYGNYAQYYEVGRVEALRQLGLSYKSVEDGGILLPVHTFSITYLKPAYYDDLLTIKTMIKELPKARLRFEYESTNEEGELLNRGETTLVFIDAKTGRPCAAPAVFIEKLKAYIKE